LKNIMSFNSFQDAQILYQSLESGDKVFVVIGGTFLGLEIASLLSSKCSKVYVIGSRSQPLEYLVGPTASSSILGAMNLVKNVVYLAPDEIKCFQGDEFGQVTQVTTLINGTISCHGVVLAMNFKPNTNFLDSTAIMMNMQTGGILVDSVSTINFLKLFSTAIDVKIYYRVCKAPWQMCTLLETLLSIVSTIVRILAEGPRHLHGTRRLTMERLQLSICWIWVEVFRNVSRSSGRACLDSALVLLVRH